MMDIPTRLSPVWDGPLPTWSQHKYPEHRERFLRHLGHLFAHYRDSFQDETVDVVSSVPEEAL